MLSEMKIIIKLQYDLNAVWGKCGINMFSNFLTTPHEIIYNDFNADKFLNAEITMS